MTPKGNWEESNYYGRDCFPLRGYLLEKQMVENKDLAWGHMDTNLPLGKWKQEDQEIGASLRYMSSSLKRPQMFLKRK